MAESMAGPALSSLPKLSDSSFLDSAPSDDAGSALKGGSHGNCEHSTSRRHAGEQTREGIRDVPSRCRALAPGSSSTAKTVRQGAGADGHEVRCSRVAACCKGFVCALPAACCLAPPPPSDTL